MRNVLTGGQRLADLNFLMPFLFAVLGLLVSLSACAPSAGVFSNGDWQSGGLQRQQIRALAVDPNAPQKIYAGAAQGSVFVSTNAAHNWTEHSLGLPLPNVIHAMQFDDPGKKLYAATDQGLFVSADAAQHWTMINPASSGLPSDHYTSIAFDLSTPTVIFVGTTTQGVFKSVDSGAHWQAINNGLPQGIAINGLVYDSDQRHLWAATSLGVYRSDDKGLSWQALNKGLPANVVVNAIQPASVVGGPSNLVYVGTNQGFFLSANAGTQWTTGQEALSGTSIHRILIDFRSANVTTVYVGADAGAFRSDDSGQTWRSIATGLPKGEPVYAMELGADGYAQLLVATNDVYLFPGYSSGIDITRYIPILIIGLFFYLLYRFTRRNRKVSSIPGPKLGEIESSAKKR